MRCTYSMALAFAINPRASPRPTRRAATCFSTANRHLGRRLIMGTTFSLVGTKNSAKAGTSDDIVEKSDEEWRKVLTPEQHHVLREAGTERPWSSALNNEKRVGVFVCAGCGNKLFLSSTKYNSGTGWPSFYQAQPGAVDEVSDWSIFFMPRTEVRCHKCKGHLGHVFGDGPRPTGQRYCMNGLALKFEPDGSA